MDEFIKKLIERLEERSEKWLNIWQNSTKDGNSNNYADGMNDAFIESTEIVKELAEEYADCYKDCEQCEAYDKGKHHCPKFCQVITDALAEIEENRGGWILCSERLPEDNQTVIGCFTSGTVTTLSFYNGVFHGIYEYNTNVIIAWQPLPAPYQPKGE